MIGNLITRGAGCLEYSYPWRPCSDRILRSDWRQACFHTAWTGSGHSLVLFDHLVGTGQDRWRHGETECLRGLEVDHQLECGRLLDRQISRLRALENLSGGNTDLTPGAGEARSIANQASGSDEFPRKVDRWYRVASSQRNELFAAVVEHRIRADDEPAGVLLDQRRESGVDLRFGV